jgi:hypothetical protein
VDDNLRAEEILDYVLQQVNMEKKVSKKHYSEMVNEIEFLISTD